MTTSTEFGADLVTVTPPEGDALPADAAGFDGAVVLGGPQSAADDGTSPYIPRLLDLMRGFADADRPILGICLGAQLLARAHGERVYQHSLMERGFKPVETTPAGADDPVMGSLGPVRHIMQWHYDTFDLPKDAVLLATGPDCANQAFRLGDSQYGLQFHPEVNAGNRPRLGAPAPKAPRRTKSPRSVARWKRRSTATCPKRPPSPAISRATGWSWFGGSCLLR